MDLDTVVDSFTPPLQSQLSHFLGSVRIRSLEDESPELIKESTRESLSAPCMCLAIEVCEDLFLKIL